MHVQQGQWHQHLKASLSHSSALSLSGSLEEPEIPLSVSLGSRQGIGLSHLYCLSGLLSGIVSGLEDQRKQESEFRSSF